MLSKSSKWELGLVHYVAEFTILRFVISRFECARIFFFPDPPPPFNSRAPSAPPPNSCHPCLPIAPLATSFMGSCTNRNTHQNSNSNYKRLALFFE